MKFDSSTTTDQKRAARGEQLRYARTFLQARDAAHNKAWKIMMLAGGNPNGEIAALRSLFPKGTIVAIDKDPSCVDAARIAGADIAIGCDLSAYEITKIKYSYSIASDRKPPFAVQSESPFDLIDLDLCANAGPEVKALAQTYHGCVNGRGVLILTFSYGRDVVPLFQDAWERLHCRDGRTAELAKSALHSLESKGASRSVLLRLSYVLSPTLLAQMRQVVSYSGAQMPICSVLIHKRACVHKEYPVAFHHFGEDDFGLLVSNLSLAVYDCTEERLAAIKRSAAAHKAARTRFEKNKFFGLTASPGQPPQPEPVQTEMV